MFCCCVRDPAAKAAEVEAHNGRSSRFSVFGDKAMTSEGALGRSDVERTESISSVKTVCLAPEEIQSVLMLCGDESFNEEQKLYAQRRLGPVLKELAEFAMFEQPSDLAPLLREQAERLERSKAGSGTGDIIRRRSLRKSIRTAAKDSYQGSYATITRHFQDLLDKGELRPEEYKRLVDALEQLSDRSGDGKTVAVNQEMFHGHEDEMQQMLGNLGVGVSIQRQVSHGRLPSDMNEKIVGHRHRNYSSACDAELVASIPFACTASIFDKVMAVKAVVSVQRRWRARQSLREQLVVTREFATSCLKDLDWDRRSSFAGCDSRVDVQLVIHAFRSHRLIDRYNIQLDRLEAWIRAISVQYQPDSLNPYHNWYHAIDVFQFTYMALTRGGAKDFFNKMDLLALLLAALGHDVAHPGKNPMFLIKTRDDLALTYNDQSPLENMHASKFFFTYFNEADGRKDFLPMSGKRCKPNNVHDFDLFRDKVVMCILATDMKDHFAMVDRIQTRRQNQEAGEFIKGSAEDRQKQLDTKKDRRMMMQAFTHTADLGHCCRPWDIHKLGVVAVEKESFAQGDVEAELGIPISPMMDRRKDSFAVGQGFFLGKMVKPLVICYRGWLNEKVSAMLTDSLDSNVEKWAELVKTYSKDGPKVPCAEEIVKWSDEADRVAGKIPVQYEMKEELVEPLPPQAVAGLAPGAAKQRASVTVSPIPK